MTTLEESPAKTEAPAQCEMEIVLSADGLQVEPCLQPVAGRRRLACQHEHIENPWVCHTHGVVDVSTLGCSLCWSSGPAQHRCDLVDLVR